MKINPSAVLFWVLCGLIAFAFGASAKVVAGVVAFAIGFSLLLSMFSS